MIKVENTIMETYSWGTCVLCERCLAVVHALTVSFIFEFDDFEFDGSIILISMFLIFREVILHEDSLEHSPYIHKV